MDSQIRSNLLKALSIVILFVMINLTFLFSVLYTTSAIIPPIGLVILDIVIFSRLTNMHEDAEYEYLDHVFPGLFLFSVVNALYGVFGLIEKITTAQSLDEDIVIGPWGDYASHETYYLIILIHVVACVILVIFKISKNSKREVRKMILMVFFGIILIGQIVIWGSYSW